MKTCSICGVVTNDDHDSLQYDCGGDCLMCMAEAGDTDCMEIAYRLLKQKLEDTHNAFNNAINFAVDEADLCADDFLDLWRHGEWDVIRVELPEFKDFPKDAK